MDREERPVLDRTDVAAILGVKPKSVSQYLVESRPPGRYAKHPFPPPDGYIGRGPWWRRDRAEEIREWAAQRPGKGVGGGRPRRDDTR